MDFFQTSAIASRVGEFGGWALKILLNSRCRYHAVLASFCAINFSIISTISLASYSIDVSRARDLNWEPPVDDLTHADDGIDDGCPDAPGHGRRFVEYAPVREGLEVFHYLNDVFFV